MRSVAILIAILALACVHVNAGFSDVTQLTADTFDEVVAQVDGPGVLVEFYAPWCGHCQALAPEYEKVATAFKSQIGKIVIAQVDADQYADLGQRFNVQGYPTIQWFPSGSIKSVEYSGPNTAAGLVKFVNQQAGTSIPVPAGPAAPKMGGKEGAISSVLTLNDENIDLAIGGPLPILVEFFAPWCGHCKNLAPHYELAAQAFRDLPGERKVIVAALDADAHPGLGHRFGVKGFPTLKYFPAGSKEEQEYKGARTATGLVNFLNEKLGTTATVPESADFDPASAARQADSKTFEYPNIIKITKETADEHIGGPVGVLVEFYAPWCQHCKSLAADYAEVGQTFKSFEKVKIAAIDADADQSLALKYNVKGFPTIQWFAPGSTVGVEYDGPRTSTGLVKFVNAKAGVQAPIPGLAHLSGPSSITQLDAKSYDSTVNDATKDVVVYFFAPWCHHCKRLLPEYEKMAAELKSTANLAITALDCDEYPDQAKHIEGFPTVIMYHKDEKKGEELNLSPTTSAADLVKLIQTAIEKGPGGSTDAAAAAAPAAPAKKVDSAPHWVDVTGGDGAFFHCSIVGGKVSEDAELRIDSKGAEVKGFPGTFSINAEQFCTYNWAAVPYDGKAATVSVTFVGGEPEGVSLECKQGRGEAKDQDENVEFGKHESFVV